MQGQPRSAPSGYSLELWGVASLLWSVAGDIIPERDLGEARSSAGHYWTRWALTNGVVSSGCVTCAPERSPGTNTPTGSLQSLFFQEDFCPLVLQVCFSPVITRQRWFPSPDLSAKEGGKVRAALVTQHLQRLQIATVSSAVSAGSWGSCATSLR